MDGSCHNIPDLNGHFPGHSVLPKNGPTYMANQQSWESRDLTIRSMSSAKAVCATPLSQLVMFLNWRTVINDKTLDTHTYIYIIEDIHLNKEHRRRFWWASFLNVWECFGCLPLLFRNKSANAKSFWITIVHLKEDHFREIPLPTLWWTNITMENIHF